MIETALTCVGIYSPISGIRSIPYIVPLTHSKVLFRFVGLKEKEFALIEKNADEEEISQLAKKAAVFQQDRFAKSQREDRNSIKTIPIEERRNRRAF